MKEINLGIIKLKVAKVIARRCILYSSEADPEADHGQAAEYPVFLSADHAPVTASDDPPLLRRSSRTRKPKNFGPDFV